MRKSTLFAILLFILIGVFAFTSCEKEQTIEQSNLELLTANDWVDSSVYDVRIKFTSDYKKIDYVGNQIVNTRNFKLIGDSLSIENIGYESEVYKISFVNNKVKLTTNWDYAFYLYKW